MQAALVTMGIIYLFAVLGFWAKRRFKERFHEATLTLVVVYLLHPFLAFWGLTRQSLSCESFSLPVIYFVIITVVSFLSLGFGKIYLQDPKDQSILAVNSVAGNVANIGIPLVLAVLGEEGVYHASLLTIANIFYLYTFGVFFYSRGSFSLKESFFNIFKLPVIWASMAAIFVNYFELPIPSSAQAPLQMGAYAGLVVQLILFGAYLCRIDFQQTNQPLLWMSTGIKTFVLPLASCFIIVLLPLSPVAKVVLFLELAVPMAVNNVNLASLYDCKPKQVAIGVLASSVLFAVLLPLYLWVAHRYIEDF
ncbi:AEC family transporter [Wolinella succinogenes]|uniref:AEC family transporter n=1 Tax=Wolinella succinogenes TaxID=844 RepID=UPI002409AEC8|nr:AEC family transporter [Wolinella succinogenes]